jgi:adenine-specific DNA-methyltransferase
MSIEKLDLQSPDKGKENFQKLAELFPNCVTESAEGKSIDFDLLKQELKNEVVEGNKERYRLEWPGKREAIVQANLPTTKTLRPIRDEKESVDFDNTENLYIEGDNLEVLKLLQESYLGKIKMIYIDPPYNTGKDFIYKDNFTQSAEEYKQESGQVDEYNNRLFPNPETSGRYHSDWLTMMYPRLKLARNLLTDDGVIFISIDDNEVHNLRKICDEIFGEGNFVSQNIRVSNSAKNSTNLTSITHDYTIIFAKNKAILSKDEWKVPKKNISEFLQIINRLLKQNLPNDEISRELRQIVKYPRFYEFDHYYYVDEYFKQLGPYASDKPGPAGGNKGYTDYSLQHPVTRKNCKIPSTGWAMNKEKALRMLGENRWHFGKDENTIPRPKAYLFEKNKSQFTGLQFFDSQKDVKYLNKIEIPFGFPKPEEFIKLLISLLPDKDSIILDFFSGSATTAHAVMHLNAEDGGKRKFIMVQIPQLTDDDGEAYKVGYKNICEIGKERIRRVGKKIKEGILDLPVTEDEIEEDELLLSADSNQQSAISNQQSAISNQILQIPMSNKNWSSWILVFAYYVWIRAIFAMFITSHRILSKKT